MCEAAAGVVALRFAAGEDLGLAGEAAEGFCVEDAAYVADEWAAVGVRRLGPGALREWVAGMIGNCEGCGERRDQIVL